MHDGGCGGNSTKAFVDTFDPDGNLEILLTSPPHPTLPTSTMLIRMDLDLVLALPASLPPLGIQQMSPRPIIIGSNMIV